jgi:uncharacterized protein (TIGR03435 family)
VLPLGLLAFISGNGTGFLGAQVTPAAETFEVATIRPSLRPERPFFKPIPAGGIEATNVTLKLLIQLAYDIQPEQLSGGPAWTDSDAYTVIAKAPAGPPLGPEVSQQELMRRRLRALLIDRFHLDLKRGTKQTIGYVLKSTKNHNMTLATDPGVHQLRQIGRWQLRAEGVDMPLFARFLGAHLGTTVKDQTGLQGRFNFDLNWTPVPVPSSVASLDGLPEETLIPAVQDQLGLKLERQIMATDRYTIEHAEKPTEN